MASDPAPTDPASSSKVRCSVLHGAKDLRLDSRVLSLPLASEVQVAVKTTGLCGSDLHYYNHFRNGDIICREPLTLGHESAGVVTAVGSSVTDLKIGDLVALEVGLPCGQCELCEQGRYNICPSMKFRSSAKAFPHFQGTLQERINHPSAYAHRLPADLSLEMGALLEPLSVAIHANRRAQLTSSPKVLVFGAGAVGLLVAAVVRMQVPDARIIIADIDPGRVKFAVENHFAHAGFDVPLRRGQSIEENLQIAQETASAVGNANIDGRAVGQVDAVFECTGVPSCLQASIYATKPGGRVMLIGMGTPIQTLPISAAALREVDIIGVFRYANTYPEGIKLLSKAAASVQKVEDVPRFDKLVTHKYHGFENLGDAFGMAGKTKDAEGNLVLKVMWSVDGLESVHD